MQNTNQNQACPSGQSTAGSVKEVPVVEFSTDWGWMQSHLGRVSAATAEDALASVVGPLVESTNGSSCEPFWEKGELVAVIYFGEQGQGEEGVDWGTLRCSVKPL